MKIVVTVNTSFNLVNFRSKLLQALVSDGYMVSALVPVDEMTPRLKEMGVPIIGLVMNNKGTSPLKEAALILRIVWALWRERADAVLGFTIKNNIYGGLGARLLGIPFLPNVTGLGVAFDQGHWLEPVVRMLYRFAFSKAPAVFFQNPDDQALFLSAGLVRPHQARLLPGSGVDLRRFKSAPLAINPGAVRFLLVSRMLWDKGVGEYVAAARRVKRTYPQTVFRLLGPLGVQNPAAIFDATMRAWVDEGTVEYLGAAEDVRPFMKQADCVVLPSFYREGTPRSLLEAAALARPIITTDMPGCRDTVDHGVNGFLCRARDSYDLASKIIQMIEAGPQKRTEMGRQGRIRMERNFDERIVIEAYRNELRKLHTVREEVRSRVP